ncbi:MAG: hypothetical protein EXS01_05090 [Phycisphaerales bacterium]|nr:hypothetical protein [Phycisphaerales bacterium]
MRRSFAVITLCLAGVANTQALAADAPREVKSEFQQNIVRRDRMVRELIALDSKGADAVAAGKEPIATHADQVKLQDQIDLIQLRLETLALRWDLNLPDPPKEGKDELDEATITSQRIESAFQEGRNRSQRVLANRCISMLASIDYDAFLARPE